MDSTHEARPAPHSPSSESHSEADGHHPEPALNEEEWLQIMTDLRVSPREGELVRAVCCDLKDQAIAVRMDISVHTVRTHFERLFRKLGVHTRVGIVIRVLNAYYQTVGVERGRNP